MKKILPLTVLFAILLSFSVSATEENVEISKSNVPTYSFDTDAKNGDISVIESTNPETGEMGNLSKIEFSTSTDMKISGGSLKITTTLNETLAVDFQGIRITADKLGLENFDGCTIKMNIYLPAEVIDVFSFAQLFYSGGGWKDTSVDVSADPKWSVLILTVPESAKMTEFGLKLPINSPYSGVLCYVDNIFIYAPDGSVIMPDEDFDASAETVTTTQVTTAAAVASITQATTTVTTTAAEDNENQDEDEGSNPIVIIIIALVGVSGLLVLLIVLKEKRRFY